MRRPLAALSFAFALQLAPTAQAAEIRRPASVAAPRAERPGLLRRSLHVVDRGLDVVAASFVEALAQHGRAAIGHPPLDHDGTEH